MPHPDNRSRRGLRPRAGGPATALFLAGLGFAAVSAAVAPLGARFVAPASAQSAASRIDQPTAGTLPPGTTTVKEAHPEAAHKPNDGVSAPRALKPSTAVTPDEGGGRVNPKDHLPGSMRRGG
ncbi:hypothetical protein [Methylobacterium gregans]|uniref:Uncharacterized protein n=1 Tax=Methylobacterium gregans TaxID=374424 RepID=A0AA37MB24_9HYPH|nr:hypothetical protein [Methylobacterium gregans]MDQ0520894.1 hypothetical protein [Methylobacterium gregans]GJD79352.1 hypothetical protein NBEOAGPD_2577 [Methylobacterium gregans]GLS53158.1 hypothetical protein GCM10007886_13410 [Methylobacterium gregans]